MFFDLIFLLEWCSARRSNLTFLLQIDLKNADPDRVEAQIEKVFDIPREECIRVSRRT